MCGFVVALAILYALMMVMSFAMQIMFMTIVLMCLFSVVWPAIWMYYTIIQYVAFTQAYKVGKDGLSVEAQVG